MQGEDHSRHYRLAGGEVPCSVGGEVPCSVGATGRHYGHQPCAATPWPVLWGAKSPVV